MTKHDDQFDDLARQWRNQRVESNVGKDILMHVKTKARKFNRTIFWRDARELLAGVLVLAYMGGKSLFSAGWLPKVGGLFVAACGAFVLVRLLGSRRQHRKISEDLPLVQRLQAEIAKVQTQVELLSNVRSWYVLPLAAGGTVWVATLPRPTLIAGLPVINTVLVVLCSVLLFAIVGWVVEKLNLHVVRTSLVPYRDELQEILDRARAEDGTVE